MIALKRHFLTCEPLGRAAYFLAGTILLVIKFAIDWAVAHALFHRSWSPAEYIAPGASLGYLVVAPHERLFYATMLLIALPFIACGVLLTAMRLRSVGMPVGWTVLFFVPGINFGMFALLSGLPSRTAESSAEVQGKKIAPSPHAGDAPVLAYAGDAEASRAGLGGVLPVRPTAALAVAILLPALVALAATFASIHFFEEYGWGVFVGVPFAVGLMSAVLYGARTPRTIRQCIGIACLSLTAYGVALLMFAFEGAGCLIMAAPLAYPVTILGAVIGASLCGRRPSVPVARRVVTVMMLFLPAFLGAEKVAAPEAPVYVVTSAVEIDAPPERVWNNVIGFGQIPPPQDWIFRTGIAYPIRAEISGRGPGATRLCVFSTGPFVEPISVWDEPRLLKFSVSSNPPPMKEWSPYRDLHPPHLENFLVSEGGQFRLIELPGGRTRLEGTTWYRHHMWPAAYWRVWSDAIIHRIHLRVLNHVKALSEQAPGM
jgi:hypothetical protein